MSAEISKWLLDGIDMESLESENVEPLATTDIADYYNAPGYSNAYNDYSDYYNYYNYYNYYDYYNYSNSISVTMHPISQSVLVNERVTFSVGASNTIDSCQWYVSDSNTGTGTAISGATSPTYSFIVDRSDNDKYYYCIVKRGGNSATSQRATLTVLSVNAYDIFVTKGSSANLVFIRATPSTTTISSVVVADTSIATSTNEGMITGVSVGTTTCSVIGSNGATATFNITVLNEDELIVAVLANIAIAIREYKGLSHSIYPNQMANLMRGNPDSLSYNSLEELFLDLADTIRVADGTTDTIMPKDFYYRILSLTQ